MTDFSEQPRLGRPPNPDLQVGAAEVCLIPVAAIATGLSEKAIRRKIESGVWVEGREYWRAPDEHLYVDMKGYARWVRGGRDPV